MKSVWQYWRNLEPASEEVLKITLEVASKPVSVAISEVGINAELDEKMEVILTAVSQVVLEVVSETAS